MSEKNSTITSTCKSVMTAKAQCEKDDEWLSSVN